jgi:hypothetical protein
MTTRLVEAGVHAVFHCQHSPDIREIFIISSKCSAILLSDERISGGNMNSSNALLKRTRINWLINAGVFLSGVVTALSGIYFLFLPSGGYQGGRNAAYGVTVLFDRSTWDHLHTWSGVIMVIMIALHVVFHWDWIKMMARRVVGTVKSDGAHMSAGSRRNLVLNSFIASGFMLAAISGIYFLFIPKGGFQGGRNLLWDPGFLWSRATWDLIHTWAGVIVIVLAVLHFAIHWGWVRKVTARFFQLPGKTSVSEPAFEIRT